MPLRCVTVYTLGDWQEKLREAVGHLGGPHETDPYGDAYDVQSVRRICVELDAAIAEVIKAEPD